jgi:hypothetical protein
MFTHVRYSGTSLASSTDSRSLCLDFTWHHIFITDLNGARPTIKIGGLEHGSFVDSMVALKMLNGVK